MSMGKCAICCNVIRTSNGKLAGGDAVGETAHRGAMGGTLLEVVLERVEEDQALLRSRGRRRTQS